MHTGRQQLMNSSLTFIQIEALAMSAAGSGALYIDLPVAGRFCNLSAHRADCLGLEHPCTSPS